MANNKRLLMFCIGSVLVFSGCASHKVIIDTQEVDQKLYQKDLADCKAYGKQVEVEEGVAKSAVFGALVGFAIGVALGNSDVAADMATIGAIEGAAGGALDGDLEQADVVKNCLRERGYAVLN